MRPPRRNQELLGSLGANVTIAADDDALRPRPVALTRRLGRPSARRPPHGDAHGRGGPALPGVGHAGGIEAINKSWPVS
jgi:hypothetical protein